MALKKEIIEENGLIISYHRIANFSADKDKKIMTIQIRSYANEDYRIKEKESNDFETLLAEKYELVSKLVEENDSHQYDEQILQLSTEINSLNELKNQMNNLDTHLLSDTQIIEFSNDNQYNLSILYEVLKETERYKDSIDV